jgi:uncharacterized membrane protein
MKIQDFFSAEEKLNIQHAIEQAERNTSGEIRVHLENKCTTDPTERAIVVFNELKMYKTKLRNGVLFYLAIDDHKFALIGDKGINETVEIGFWDSTRDLMLSHFKMGEFTQGLCEAIDLAGQRLKTHFPYKQDDTNELSNEISYGQPTSEE